MISCCPLFFSQQHLHPSKSNTKEAEVDNRISDIMMQKEFWIEYWVVL